MITTSPLAAARGSTSLTGVVFPETDGQGAADKDAIRRAGVTDADEGEPKPHRPLSHLTRVWSKHHNTLSLSQH